MTKLYFAVLKHTDGSHSTSIELFSGWEEIQKWHEKDIARYNSRKRESDEYRSEHQEEFDKEYEGGIGEDPKDNYVRYFRYQLLQDHVEHYQYELVGMVEANVIYPSGE
jgi:hypothetical protein